MNQEADQLPNWVVPEMNSVGAMEIGVSAALGACDFISAMDTARIPEWNMVSPSQLRLPDQGERRNRLSLHEWQQGRAGQGSCATWERIDQLSFDQWCQGSNKVAPMCPTVTLMPSTFGSLGSLLVFGKVSLSQTETVRIKASVAFAPATPQTVAQGLLTPPGETLPG